VIAGRTLALIPSRGGSKGLPGKNIKALAGRPLIAHAVDAARSSKVVDRVVVSTDSMEIAAIARAAGAEVPFLRPAALAEDATPMLPVIEHAIKALSADGWTPEAILLLQPTSPLRRPEHLVRAIEELRDESVDSVVTVVRVPRHLSPDYVMRIDDGQLVPFLPQGAAVTRRQDAREAFVRDGTVYAFRRATVLEQGSIYGRNCRPLIIPAQDSITIDTQEDWDEAERRLGAR
jgi:N-acylneuraminate cytidylyltransferase